MSNDVTEEDTRRRLRAARALAGLTVEQLAEKTGSGLGAKTLYNIERGERDIRPMELREIARACDLPVDFFYFPFKALDGVMELWPDEETKRYSGVDDDEVVTAALGLYRGVASQTIANAKKRNPDLEPMTQGVFVESITETLAELRDARQTRTQYETAMAEVRTLAQQLDERLSRAEELTSSISQRIGRAEAAQALEEAGRLREPLRGSNAEDSGDRPPKDQAQ